MKTLLKIAGCGISIAAFCLLAAFGHSDEDAAIKAVIEKETTGYFGRDVAAWSSCYKQDAQTVVCGGALGGSMVTQGWAALQATAEAAQKGDFKPLKYQVERSNWHIQQSGNTAFATFDQTLTVTDWPGTNYTKEIRCLEKVGSAWKIVALSWTEKTNVDTDASRASLKAVIAAETQAYFAHDYAGWADCWMQDKSVAQTWNNQDGSIGQTLDFEKIAAAAKAGMQGEKTTFQVDRDHWDIQIYGPVAAVHFDQKFTDAKGKTFYSKELRTMFWDGAHWKIAQVNAFWDYKNAK